MEGLNHLRYLRYILKRDCHNQSLIIHILRERHLYIQNHIYNFYIIKILKFKKSVNNKNGPYIIN